MPPLPLRPSSLTHSLLRALAVLLVAPTLAFAQYTAGSVSASGTSSITVEPNLAVVTIQYSAAGRTPALAGRAAARRANAIRAAIIALGIPADSLPTTGANSWRWGGWGNRSSIQVRNDMKDTSYVTNDAFQVRVHNLALVGRVVDTALVEGAQTISNVDFQATNTESVRLAAVREATKEARAQAAAVAEATGLTLGRVLNINVNAPPMVVSMASPMADGMVAFARRAETSTTVVAPELKVQVSVNGSWEMVSGRP